MASYDERAQATAARMLAPKASGGKGQTVVLDLATSGAYAPASGTVGAVAGARQTGSGIEEHYRADRIDGRLVLAGDVRFMLSPLATSGEVITTAVPGAVVAYEDGREWAVISTEPFAPAGVLAYTYLQLRRS